MDRTSTDYSVARQLMVDGQVRPNKVRDARIIEAMRTVAREAFVPPAQAAVAYADTPVPLGGGRTMLTPMAIARLLETARVRAGERVLVVGAATGYSAALLAACGARVTALESDPALVAHMRQVLAGFGGVTIVAGPLASGSQAHAPFDLMLIDGAYEDLPPALVAQLDGASGRLVGIRSIPGRIGQAVLGEPVAGTLSIQAMFDCVAPTLPTLQRSPEFAF